MAVEIVRPAAVVTERLSRGILYPFAENGEQVPAGFEDAYDQHAVIYDAFLNEDGSRITVLGPPLGAFAGQVLIAADISHIERFEAGCADSPVAVLGTADDDRPQNATGAPVSFTEFTRFFRAEVSAKLLSDQGTVTVVVRGTSASAEREVFTIQPRESAVRSFAQARVLHTLQKDNELEWIGDWVRFYERVHGVDTVLLYDNGSEKYALAGLTDFLTAECSDDMRIVIVDWRFPYGPAMHPWDCFFLQTATLDHSLRAWCAQAAWMVNADIDEYMLTTGPVFSQTLRESAGGAVQISGFWVSNSTLGEVEDRPRVWNYGVSVLAERSGPKWVVEPQTLLSSDSFVQLETHSVAGVPIEADERLRMAHVKALTTRLAHSHRHREHRANSECSVDPLWVDSLERAFPGQVPGEARSLAYRTSFRDARIAGIDGRQTWLQGYCEGALSRWEWERVYLWRDYVLVFETRSLLASGALVAFDFRFRPFEGKLWVAALVRNEENAGELRELLEEAGHLTSVSENQGRGWRLAEYHYPAAEPSEIARDMTCIVNEIMEFGKRKAEGRREA